MLEIDKIITDNNQNKRIGDMTRGLEKIVMAGCVKLAPSICTNSVIKVFLKMYCYLIFTKVSTRSAKVEAGMTRMGYITVPENARMPSKVRIKRLSNELVQSRVVGHCPTRTWKIKLLTIDVVVENDQAL